MRNEAADLRGRPATNPAIRYLAEPTRVREVSLHGTADLGFWTARLRSEQLVPVAQGNRAHLQIVAAEMAFLGIRFTEISFAVSVFPPEGAAMAAVFLVQAFNSRRLFAFCERAFFATPYSHAECRVSLAAGAAMRVFLGGKTVFRAEMPLAAPARELLHSGDDGWEGLVFLPAADRRRGGAARFFFGRMTGHARAYPYVPTTDVVAITPARDTGIFGALLDSGFAAEKWILRADATHGKSRSYDRAEVFDRLAGQPLTAARGRCGG